MVVFFGRFFGSFSDDVVAFWHFFGGNVATFFFCDLVAFWLSFSSFGMVLVTLRIGFVSLFALFLALLKKCGLNFAGTGLQPGWNQYKDNFWIFFGVFFFFVAGN